MNKPLYHTSLGLLMLSGCAAPLDGEGASGFESHYGEESIAPAAADTVDQTEVGPYDEDSAVSVGKIEQSLFRPGAQWPNNIVPVCFVASSRNIANWPASYGVNTVDEFFHKMRITVNASWPAVANVEFTGWGACPPDLTGKLAVYLDNLGGAGAQLGYTSGWRGAWVTLGVNYPDGAPDFFGRGLLPHEFGHALGFAHEHDRPDFPDDAVDAPGDCFGGGGGDTSQYLDTPPDRASIMASTGYCQTNINLSGWDKAGVKRIEAYGPREDRVIVNGSTVYAQKLSNGDIYKYNGAGTSWTRIGAGAAKFVVAGGSLYSLARWLDGVYKYSGTGTTWTRIGENGQDIFQCGASLCAANLFDGTVFRYVSGSSWTRLSNEPAAMYASTSTNLFRLRADRSAVDVYSGSGTTWNQIGGAALQIFASGANVFATDPNNGALHRHISGQNWTFVGNYGRHFVARGNALYGLDINRAAVLRWDSGASWTSVGGSAGWIYGHTGSSNLYATNPVTNTIHRYSSGTAWTDIGQP